jgi:4-azaleucine resistance transporter AzlC
LFIILKGVNNIKKVLKYAFIKTIPVLFGYLFLGVAFGILLQKAGYNFIWAFFMSLFVFAGSMQYAMVGMLGSGMNFVSVILMTLSINGRHIFYGLSFIEKFKRMGKAYFYMIFSLTDETYSLLCAEKTPDSLDENRVFLSIAILNHIYWISGSVLGAIAGEFITFNTKGIDFAMTALFTVIFVEQWLASRSKIPAITGILCGGISLLIFGPGKFILPSLISAIVILLALKGRMREHEEMCDVCMNEEIKAASANDKNLVTDAKDKNSIADINEKTVTAGLLEDSRNG